jgi:hypothetical protein
MMSGDVIDIKTKKAIFGNELREKLESGLEPHLVDGGPVAKERAAITVEQIICTALVSAAVAFATKIAHGIAGKLTTNKP